jgi:hypothetical protein
VPYAGRFTRKVLGETNPDLIRALQKVSLDRSLARRAGESMIEAAFSVTSSSLAKLVFHKSLDTVFDNAESPLEIQFFTSLLIHSLPRHYMGFWVEVCHPSSGCREQVEDYAKSALPVAEQYFRWKATNPEPGEFKNYLIRSGVPASEAKGLETLAEFEFDFGLYYRPRIMLQPRFPEIRVEGRSLRADALVYIPGNPNARIIVECDGWVYHRDKQSFRRDRARDRAFTDSGYIVRRYAGAEIHESVFDASYDLVEYIYATFDCTNASAREWIDEFKKSRDIA